MDQIDDIEGTILQNRCVVPGYYLATIRLARPMARPRPGQFVMIMIPSVDVFLRRPFSIYAYGNAVLSILYRVVGRGTAALAVMGHGWKVMVLGPLGNGFTSLPGHAPVLVAGGIGAAGIHLLWTKMKKKGTLFWGCTTEGDVGLLKKVIPYGPHISTIDGSFGCKGNVVELLAQHIDRMKRPIQVFACGPEAMFRSLKSLLHDEGTACQVLVEEKMACGLGICFGCVKRTLDENEPYKRVCKEGPVFDLWQISL
ncbi:MAG: dihydroorotate dehydrogenase electron transfer subunit [Syntrophorhabdales bacterium]|jgi:dihydroorotate dehydrogenase electron transfer subunit